MSSDWEEQVDREIPRYSSRLGSLAYLGDKKPELKLIIDTVLRCAANRSLNAGYAGSHGDDGASSSVDELKSFLEGFQFALGGDAGDYQQIVDEHAKKLDPEYKKYLELKQKFEK